MQTQTKYLDHSAKAMQGMCAHHGSYGVGNGVGQIADRAYEIADAMLNRLSNPL